MSIKELEMQVYENLKEQYRLLSNKYHELKMSMISETDAAIKHKLKLQMEEILDEQDSTESRMKEIGREFGRIEGDVIVFEMDGDHVSSSVEWSGYDPDLLNDYFSLCADSDEENFKNYQDWDPDKIKEYLIEHELACEKDSETYLTRAGLLLCGKRTKISTREFYTDVRFTDKSGNEDLIDHLDGSVLYLYQQLSARLKPLFARRMGSPDIRNKNGTEKIFFEYPKVVITEALVNFLIHRDYKDNDLGFIDVYPDRVVFINPGKSWFSPEKFIESIGDLYENESDDENGNGENGEILPKYSKTHRNPYLIRAMSKTGLNQMKGSGIARIKEVLEDNRSFLPDGSPGLFLHNDEENDRFMLVIYKRAGMDINEMKLFRESQAGYTPLVRFEGFKSKLRFLNEKLDRLRKKYEKEKITIEEPSRFSKLGAYRRFHKLGTYIKRTEKDIEDVDQEIAEIQEGLRDFQNEKKLLRNYKEFEQEWSSISEKIAELRRHLIVESDPDDKFVLEKQIEETEEKRDKIEKQMIAIEERFSEQFAQLETFTAIPIKGYDDVKMIGEGGFSVVYRAVEKETGCIKAIKVPKNDYVILPESELLAKLDGCPGIVPIEKKIEYGGGDRVLLVMPYIGNTLCWYIKEKEIQPHNIDQILQWMKDLLKILIFAHEKGIIHLGIKPSNILIDDQKNLYLTDFGIAQKIQYAEFKYSTIVRGTICYMSPEQQLAEPVTSQTDLYSFGAVFYELVTGEKPVGRFKDPSYHQPDLPKKLEEIINRCLETDLSERYQTAKEVLDDIENIHK